jgi:hypothetical protein
MLEAILRESPDLLRWRKRLLGHALYNRVNTIPRLRRFMESHVFAVWDFMSLAKRLQRDLTCIDLPWLPAPDATLARFVNEVVWVEESDLGPDGAAASHLELYLAAMREVGADTSTFDDFADRLRRGQSLKMALSKSHVPDFVKEFVTQTITCATKGTTVQVAASFLYGREDLIPEMFGRFLPVWPDGKATVPTFIHYLQRHIEVDGEDHGPVARRLLEQLVGGKPQLWRAAAISAQSAIEGRVRLWDGILADIKTLPKSARAQRAS